MPDELKARIERLSPEKRALLDKLMGAGGSAKPAGREASTRTETLLVEIWSEVFGVQALDVDADFFQLGGDSILSIQLVAKAKRRGLHFSSRDLFEFPILSKLAQVLERRGPQPIPHAQPPSDVSQTRQQTPAGPSLAEQISGLVLDAELANNLTAGARSGAIVALSALSPVQQGMLYHILSDGGRGAYLEQTLCTLRGALNVTAFTQAWQILLEVHPILRTGFIWEGVSKPLQVEHRSASLPVETLDWRGLTRQQQQDAHAQWLEADGRRAFDLATPPLMRLMLARVDEQEHWLVWSSYHLILDAWSLPILLRQLSAVYRALCAGEPASLPPARSYADFVRWLESADASAARSFWVSRLQGVKPTPCRPQHALTSARSPGQIEREMSAAESKSLYAAMREQHLTLSTLAQAAWALLLANTLGCEDVVFGTAVAGRSAPLSGIETIVGPLLNTVPARVLVRRELTVRGWLGILQNQQREMEPFESTSLAEVLRLSGLPAGAELFDSMLVVLGSVAGAGETIGDIRISGVRARGRSNYPLVLRFAPEESLRLEALYDGAVFNRSWVEHVLGCLEDLMRRMAGHPEAVVDELPRATLVNPGGNPGDQAGVNSGAVSGVGSGGTPSANPRAAAVPLQPARAASIRFERRTPTPIKLERGALVQEGTVGTEPRTIAMVRPKTEALDASDWVRGNLESVTGRLREHGAVLLRGFSLGSLNAFEQLARHWCGELMEYKERSTPRTALGGRVYTSTEYPASETIALHNEFSYGLRWPLGIAFHCVLAPEEGGETPLADCGHVYAQISPEVRERFVKRGVMYVRNYGQGVDLTWQEAFQTSDRTEVERYCRETSIVCEWRSGDRLRTRQVRRAVVAHPENARPLWFNQAHLFHVSNLSAPIAEALSSSFDAEELPRNAYYGDGSRIPAEDLEEVRSAFRRSEVVFPWERGDILLVDNMRMAHGRRAFRGERRVVVCMGAPLVSAEHGIVPQPAV